MLFGRSACRLTGDVHSAMMVPKRLRSSGSRLECAHERDAARSRLARKPAGRSGSNIRRRAEVTGLSHRQRARAGRSRHPSRRRGMVRRRRRADSNAAPRRHFQSPPICRRSTCAAGSSCRVVDGTHHIDKGTLAAPPRPITFRRPARRSRPTRARTGADDVRPAWISRLRLRPWHGAIRTIVRWASKPPLLAGLRQMREQ